MPNHSSVIQIGHITRDPELRSTPSGKSVAKSGLATNHRFGQGDQSKDEVCFIDFEIWGASAESLAKHVHKGDAILIEGRLKMDQWDDKATGQKRSKLKVTADSITFIGGQNQGQDPAQGRQAAPSQAPQQAQQSAPDDLAVEDIPF